LNFNPISPLTSIRFIFREEPLSIYHLSYTLYTLTGLAVVLSVGLTVSYLTGGQDLDKLDPDHLTPPVQYFFLRSRSAKKLKRQVVGSAVAKNNAGDIESPKLLESLLSEKSADCDSSKDDTLDQQQTK